MTRGTTDFRRTVPAPRASQQEKWTNDNAGVIAYDLRTFRTLWDKPTLSVGALQDLQGERLTSLCILNISHCVREDWPTLKRFPVKPKIAFVERDVRTGRVLRQELLDLPATEARNLYLKILRGDPVKISRSEK